MEDDKLIKMDLLYGYAIIRPEPIQITTGPPFKWYESLWYGFLEFWRDVVVPSFLFALAFVAFKFALLGHF